jgi:hypothetical protein
MNAPKLATDRFVSRCLQLALLALLLGVSIAPLGWSPARADGGDDQGGAKFRWDIIQITNFSPLTINAGGMASARANNGAAVTLMGSGTFVVGQGEGSQGVTGGGTWQAFDENTNSIGTGTYKVTALISFDIAPGSPLTGTIDNIGDGTLTDNRGGLAVLRIKYSDGSRGTLVVSCHLPGAGPPETPETVFEGVTVTKDYVAYWNREAPVPGVDGNRTLFHALPSGQNDQGENDQGDDQH